MAKKTIIKRASKTWPQSDKNDRLAQAINVLNQHEGFTDDAIDVTPREIDYITEDQQTEINDLLKELYGDNEKLIEKCLGFMRIESVEKMPAADYRRHLNGLKDMLAKKQR